jgi:hypothetical protein
VLEVEYRSGCYYCLGGRWRYICLIGLSLALGAWIDERRSADGDWRERLTGKNLE